jgi:quinoprotein glucose dehydrogenase
MTRLRLFICSTVLVAAAASGLAQRGASAGEWRYYGGDPGSTKYSPIDQITAANASRLEIAWRRPHIDPRFQVERVSSSFRSTPLMIDGVLYASNGVGVLEAFDAETGRTLWVQDPAEGTGKPLQGSSSRAPAYWKGGDERLFTVRGTFLYAVNAKTGKAIPGFGQGGRVSLAHLGDPTRYYWNSPPVVVRDVVIVGSSSSDNAREQKGRPGDITAYDVRTGQLRWTFHVIPRGEEFGVDTWKDDSWKYTGAANVWVPFTADEETGYVYLPISTPTADWYGGHRRGDNLFAESLVCIDSRTGLRIWHFQMVHHGLWDYDLPAAPVLGDITVGGRRIKAVMQVTKQAFVFAFDRATGKPVWPIEERPVPPSDAPGEEASPTQPFPTKPAPFDRQGLTIDDLIDFTPELRAEAVEFVKQYRIGPVFTPPSVATATNRGTIALPGWAGGANWGGGAFDPETGMFYIPSVTNPFLLNLVKPEAGKGDVAYIRGEGGDIVGPRGLPIVKPPYGRITAIDMNRGEHVWMVPNGDGPRDHPLLKPLNLPPLGQAGRVMPLLTKTLLFLGEGDPVIVATPPLAGGRKFRAFDKPTGRVVWETELPAGLTGAPMTYLHKGRQYVVVPIGARDHAAEFVAFALAAAPSTGAR